MSSCPKEASYYLKKELGIGYQEVNHVPMLTDKIYQVWPCPGGKTSTPRIMID
jgi:hypothetical protein